MSLIEKATLMSSIGLMVSSSVLAGETTSQQITKASEHVVNQAPLDKFTGKANFSRYPVLPSSGGVAPAIVNFEVNTITNWHIHPHGQYLIVTEGQGRTQEWGQAIQNIKEGDVVWCPPGVKHWHGASEHSPMTHIAISPVAKDGGMVTWLERVDLSSVEKEKPQQPQVDTQINLNSKQLSLVPIAAFSATGNIEKLKPALVTGLDNGLTVNEIKEAFAHQYAYAGFPRALNGMLTFRSLLEERQEKGIKDSHGPLPSKLPDDSDYYQLGSETLAFLNQKPVAESSQPLFDNFSPTMDHALKTHLFGYLFSRDNLSHLERELVVIGTLSALGNVNPQLKSHLRIAGNLGVDQDQMQKVMKTLEQEVNADMARNAQTVLQQLP